MKLISAFCVTAALIISGAASAQNPPAKSSPGNSAVNSGDKNSSAPVAGRNSFTEGEAKTAIEKAGYTNVAALKKDNNGVWRGTASKDGKSGPISVDFQGNVNAGK